MASGGSVTVLCPVTVCLRPFIQNQSSVLCDPSKSKKIEDHPWSFQPWPGETVRVAGEIAKDICLHLEIAVGDGHAHRPPLPKTFLGPITCSSK